MQCRHRLREQPRNVHLADAEALRDLDLAELLDEAHSDELALTLGEFCDLGNDGQAVLDEFEFVVIAAQAVTERVAFRSWRVEGGER